jgi:hypothetical protein
VLTLAGGYGSRVKGVTLSSGSGEPSPDEISQVHVYLPSQGSLAAKVMEMKLHRLRDVRSDYGLLKQHG